MTESVLYDKMRITLMVYQNACIFLVKDLKNVSATFSEAKSCTARTD